MKLPTCQHNRTIRRRGVQRGAALVFALACTLIFSLTIAASFTLMGSQFDAVKNSKGHSRAIDIAEAGANFALNCMARCWTPGVADASVPAGYIPYDQFQKLFYQSSPNPDGLYGYEPPTNLTTPPGSITNTATQLFPANAPMGTPYYYVNCGLDANNNSLCPVTGWVNIQITPSNASGNWTPGTAEWTPGQTSDIHITATDPLTQDTRQLKVSFEPINLGDRAVAGGTDSIQFLGNNTTVGSGYISTDGNGSNVPPPSGYTQAGLVGQITATSFPANNGSFSGARLSGSNATVDKPSNWEGTDLIQTANALYWPSVSDIINFGWQVPPSMMPTNPPSSTGTGGLNQYASSNMYYLTNAGTATSPKYVWKQFSPTRQATLTNAQFNTATFATSGGVKYHAILLLGVNKSTAAGQNGNLFYFQQIQMRGGLPSQTDNDLLVLCDPTIGVSGGPSTSASDLRVVLYNGATGLTGVDSSSGNLANVLTNIVTTTSNSSSYPFVFYNYTNGEIAIQPSTTFTALPNGTVTHLLTTAGTSVTISGFQSKTTWAPGLFYSVWNGNGPSSPKYASGTVHIFAPSTSGWQLKMQSAVADDVIFDTRPSGNISIAYAPTDSAILDTRIFPVGYRPATGDPMWEAQPGPVWSSDNALYPSWSEGDFQ